MTGDQFWQNFILRDEQEIAAGFIYDGLRSLHDIDTFRYGAEIFPVLYNLAVGIERLLKVSIVLAEFDGTNLQELEGGLKIHDHKELQERLHTKRSFTLTPVAVEFLELLSTFYNKYRYDRLTFRPATPIEKDKKALLNFLHKHINIDISEDPPLFYVENSPEVKEFIGGIVKGIVHELYEAIQELAHNKNLYTYEVSGSNSKAAKVYFGDGPITFDKEERALIEVLRFFLETTDSTRIDLLKEVETLPFDPALDMEYLQALIRKKPQDLQGIVDEMEACNEEIENLRERLEIIEAIQNPHIFIPSEEE